MTGFPVFPAILLPYAARPGTFVVAEFALPTGSFKDRGAAAVVADARARGARRVTLDSSGNAGLAVAAAAARAGISAVVRVVESISPEKSALLLAAGAVLDVHATREEAARACARDADSYDASHIRNPLFRQGIATLAEAWLSAGALPETIILPVGNGSLLLGLWQGLRELRMRGAISSLPKLLAIQPERCAPIANPNSPGSGATIADGCAIRHPPAAREIRDAITESGGEAIAVSEEEIERAWRRAWREGFPIEPTSALAFAGLDHSRTPGSVALIATGSGLKACPRASV